MMPTCASKFDEVVARSLILLPYGLVRNNTRYTKFDVRAQNVRPL